VVSGDIRDETRQTLTNIMRILEGCGAALADVVKCQVFLADGKDFAAMNEVYAEFFGDAKPARTTVVRLLPSPIKVEIDAVGTGRHRRWLSKLAHGAQRRPNTRSS